jgi:hypothetical protein
MVPERVMRDNSVQTLTHCSNTEISSSNHPNLHFYGIFTGT